MSQEFSRVKVSTNKRSSIDLSHDQVTSTDFGKLIPICVRECLPNDDISLDPRVFIRLAPLAVPTFGRIKARVHTFFVPNRILWSKWDRWITGTSNVSLPYFTTQALAARASADPAFLGYNSATETPYFRGQITDLFTNLGISQDAVKAYADVTKNYNINPFPFLAYQRIWFDYFRDSNLNKDEAWFDQFKNHDYGQYSAQLVDQLVQLRRACFKKDYFTTAKLSPQDGANSASAGVSNSLASASSATGNTAIYGRASSGSSDIPFQTSSGINISQSISVPALRAATALQRYLERNNFVGARAISRFLAHFGIAPSAERLDMAEYIDGFDFPVQISDVTSTGIRESSGSGLTTSGLGTQAGKGIAAGNSSSIKYHAKEHGILMSVLSILPDTGYYQGLPKMFSRGFMGDGKFEYFTPEFENLGFQPILKREILANVSDPEQIFGYTPKYSDYKFQNDILAGDLVARGTNTGTDSYHLFRKIVDTMVPSGITETFTSCTSFNQQQYDRIFQVPGSGASAGIDHFFVNVTCICNMVRNMSSFTAPSIINSEEGDGQRIDLPYGGIRL